MTPLQWLLWLGVAVVAAALVVLHYRRRETAGRGRMLLAALRAAAVAVVLLLLFNPEVPARGPGARAGTQVLLDASLSMTVPADAAGSATRWERALELARARRGDRPVLLFGDRPRVVAPEALPETAPGDARSLLLPALQAAAEAGVRRVVIISDGAIEDAAAAARWAPRLGLEISVETVGEPLPNRAITEVSSPAWVEAGSAFAIEFAVAAPPGDSLHVTAAAGRVLARTSVPAPAPGRLAAGSLELRLDAPQDGAPVAIEVALEGTDPVPDDDRRTVYVHVSEQPTGVALVSFRPDWEPRFLAPVMEQAVGIPVRGFLAGAAGRYVRLAGGQQAGETVTEDVVQRAVAGAELVVVHAPPQDPPAWLATALRSAPGLLVFPAGETTDALPVRPPPVQAGDWFPASIPASPVAGLLAGLELSGITPLAGLMPLELPPGTWSPLLVTRGRQGAPLPALVAGSQAGRRWAVATGSGYWQWSFRGGEDRELYVRLWSAVAGWLARERRTVGLPPLRPARLALPRGLPVPWIAAGVDVDSIRVQLLAVDGAAVMDTVVMPTAADTAFTPAPEPGAYRYRATAWSGDTVVQATGPLTIERFSPEFARPPSDMAALRAAPATVRDADEVVARRGGTPLHATAWPWVLLVFLLAAEWILRRRWGLR
jgi:hypothetical protein